MEDLYTTLFTRLEENSALWHGDEGGKMIRVWTDKTDEVFSFSRDNGAGKVLALLNFTEESQTVTLSDGPAAGRYTDYFSGESVDIELGDQLEIDGYGWLVLVR